jgi:hypothetical protein
MRENDIDWQCHYLLHSLRWWRHDDWFRFFVMYEEASKMMGWEAMKRQGIIYYTCHARHGGWRRLSVN